MNTVELPCPPPIDAFVDRTMDLYRELAHAAILYVRAEREADDRMAELLAIERELAAADGVDGDRLVEIIRRKDLAHAIEARASARVVDAEASWKVVAEKLVDALEATQLPSDLERRLRDKGVLR